jgi:hypothetical protein
MPTRITRPEIDAAAKTYGVEPAALRAVCSVESSGSGFLPKDQQEREKILLERHWLWHRLEARGLDPHPLASAHPGVCGPDWNPKRYPYGSSRSQWDRIQVVLDWASHHQPERFESYKKSCYEACSWGLFQMMGFHYREAGFVDVYGMKAAFDKSEAEQLKAILRWMDGSGLLRSLRAKDWGAFTLHYNGAGQVPYYRGRLILAFHMESLRK